MFISFSFSSFISTGDKLIMSGVDPGQTASMMNRKHSHSKTYCIMKLSNEIISMGLINMNNSRIVKRSTSWCSIIKKKYLNLSHTHKHTYTWIFHLSTDLKVKCFLFFYLSTVFFSSFGCFSEAHNQTINKKTATIREMTDNMPLPVANYQVCVSRLLSLWAYLHCGVSI